MMVIQERNNCRKPTINMIVAHITETRPVLTSVDYRSTSWGHAKLRH